MILGSIYKNDFKEKRFPEVIQNALSYLLKTDFSKLSNGKHLLQGEKMFVIIDEYKTEPLNEKLAEAHKKYIDIQFMISGKESIGFSLDGKGGELIEAYSDAKDAELYKALENESSLVLVPGDYAIFFPGEIHRPGCFTESESVIKKAIVKISVNLI